MDTSIGEQLESLAERQLADYDARSPGTMFAGLGETLSIEDAYRLQIATARLRENRGEKIAGYKIGCVSLAVRKQLNVEHAVFGHVFQTEIWISPAILPADRFCQLGVEGEFALMIAEDVADPERIRAEPHRWVRSVSPVIELHNVVFRGAVPSAAELIANNALQAGIVASWDRAAPCSPDPLRIRVSINGAERGVACVDPAATLHELACRLDAHGIKLRAGDIVLGGSPLPLYSVAVGDRIQVDCPAITSVAAVCGHA